MTTLRLAWSAEVLGAIAAITGAFLIDTKTPLVLSAMMVDARAWIIRPAIFAHAGATKAAQQEIIDHGGILIDLQRLSADLSA